MQNWAEIWEEEIKMTKGKGQELENINREFPMKYEIFGKITRKDIITGLSIHCAYEAHNTNVPYEIFRQSGEALFKVASAATFTTGIGMLEKYICGHGATNGIIANLALSPVTLGLAYGIKRSLFGRTKATSVEGEYDSVGGLYTYSLGAVGHFKLLKNWLKIGKMQKEGKIRTAENPSANYIDLYCFDRGICV